MEFQSVDFVGCHKLNWLQGLNLALIAIAEVRAYATQNKPFSAYCNMDGQTSPFVTKIYISTNLYMNL